MSLQISYASLIMVYANVPNMSNEINCNDPIAIITQILDDMQKEQGKKIRHRKSQSSYRNFEE